MEPKEIIEAKIQVHRIVKSNLPILNLSYPGQKQRKILKKSTKNDC